MKIPGHLREPLFYLRILTITSVLSISLQISKTVASTSEENTSGQIESLEVSLGELKVKATGKNTTEVLTNLTQIVKRLETNISEEKY